ncbi:PREDICTED: uncharacterized protein LOC109461655 [Branchiostoma belcheri]|uniref:Uncharacterized protein LOC109461655 n=1 Tax=Branchiostoma belcheri TaxID=7741 RepID=A0A6P4Y9Y2_BRABE|nr:PREDICTED: uncharacterized protein LOC109461655 [Branchiostoma belcheri]
MTVSGLLVLVMLGSLLTGCSCLSAECQITKRQMPSYLTLWVDCNKLNLTTLPDGIPSNTDKFCAKFNNIRNVTWLPFLPGLTWLDLGWNGMESFSWTSLRALPDLKHLYLNRNRLGYVQLGNVTEHLPELKDVDLSYNKITSLSQYELGWPQVKDAWINDNPFHCDCDLFWLIEKMACLEACKGGDEKACCLSCSACFVAGVFRYKMFKMTCHSPSGLKNLPLSEVSNRLTGCGPTTESVMVPTDLDTESRQQNNTTSLLDRSGDSSGRDPIWNQSRADESYQNDTTESFANNMGRKKGEDGDFSVLYITIIGSFLILTFILCLLGIKMKRKASTGAPNHGYPNVNQIVPPIADTAYHGTADDEGDLHYYHLHYYHLDEDQPSTPTVESTQQSAQEEGLDQERLTVTAPENTESTHNRQSQATTEPSGLYELSDANTTGEDMLDGHQAIPHSDNHCMDTVYKHPQVLVASTAMYSSTSLNHGSANIYSSADGYPEDSDDGQAATASSSLYTSSELNSANLREGMTNRGDPEIPDADEQCSEPIYGSFSQATVATASRLYNRCVTD